MTDSNHTGDTPTHATKHTVVVPNSINMVSLLGPGDELLGIIEGAASRARSPWPSGCSTRW